MLLKQELADFMPSRLFIYYNERMIEGTVDEDSGAMIRDGIKTVAKLGVCAEAVWPYDIARFTDEPPAKAVHGGQESPGDWSTAGSSRSLHQMQGCLATGFPFVFGFSVYESFESAGGRRTGVVPLPPPQREAPRGSRRSRRGVRRRHAAVPGPQLLGDHWGMGGYCTMPYAYLTNPSLASDFWAVYSVEKPAA